MDRLAALEVFVRVVETGSFTVVGRERRLSQPTVSRYVSRLESEVGARLLHRTTRAVKVTDAGMAFYASAARALRDLSAAKDDLLLGSNVHSGKVRVAASVAFGLRYVAPATAELGVTHPELEIELLVSDRTVDLVTENVDVAVRLGPVSDTALVARNLGTSEIVLVASRTYLETHGRPRNLRDLVSHRCVGHLGAHREAGDRWLLTTARGPTRVPIRATLRADSPEAVFAAVKHGAGVGVLARWMMREELASGELEIVLPQHAPPPFPIRALHLPHRTLPARVKVFVEHLAAFIRRRGL